MEYKDPYMQPKASEVDFDKEFERIIGKKVEDANATEYMKFIEFMKYPIDKPILGQKYKEMNESKGQDQSKGYQK